MNISAVVLVKNEEKNIVDSLESLQFCDEIIVIDDSSQDRTIDLVKELEKRRTGIKVFKRTLDGDFSSQRKFGVDRTTNDWVLFIDADERVSDELSAEIKEVVLEEFGGFLIPRVDFMWGKELKFGETGNTRLLRLFNKHKGNLKGKVHETWETKQRVGTLTYPIFHYPHPTISKFLEEINFYTDLRAQELFEKRVRSNLFKIIIHTKGKFVVNYFLKLGFLDGVEGFVHAIIMSFHSFLVRSKLWLLWKKKQAS